MTTRALKLKLEPTNKQYSLLNEMFWKWASLANRVSQKGASKETLAPKEGTKKIQFNATQLNQVEKDVKDLRGAMDKQRKQKERLIVQTQERLSTIRKMLEDDSKKERDRSRPQNFRPIGWRKFHGIRYWNIEVEKLTRQADRIQKTIQRIEAGKINFKPKRIGLWSGTYKINFFRKRVTLGPLKSKSFELALVTEPKQEIIGKDKGKSVANSKKYLDDSIKSLLVFALHSRLFGLNNTDKYLMSGKIAPEFVKYYKNSQDKENFKEEAIKKLENKLKREISEKQKGIISSQVDRQYENRDEVFSKEYLEAVSQFSEIFNQRKDARTKYLLDSFGEKIRQIKSEISGDISEKDLEIFEAEAENAYNCDKGFTEYAYSEKYLGILRKIADSILINDTYFDLRKYPILLRKPLNKTKKMANLNPAEWDYYIQFGYDLINSPTKIETKNFLGIDRGLTHLLAYSIFDKESGKFIVNQLESNPIKGWKWKLRKLKRSLQHLERRMRAQKGVKLPENQMKKGLKSIEQRVESYYHNLSRKIVNLAKFHTACIVVESLEGGGLRQHGRKKNAKYRTLNYALSLFDYGKIASLIKYKSDLEGIPMYDVLPAYTSQQCARCVLKKGDFVEPEIIGYIEDVGSNNGLLTRLFEGTELSSFQVLKKSKGKITLSAQDIQGKIIELILKYNFKGLVILQEQTKEEIAEFPIKETEGKLAILDSVYKRGKEIIGKKGNQKVFYTGNKKAGYCSVHGQVDADLNASRVIALCKHFGINEPVVFGDQRKPFK